MFVLDGYQITQSAICLFSWINIFVSSSEAGNCVRNFSFYWKENRKRKNLQRCNDRIFQSAICLYFHNKHILSSVTNGGKTERYNVIQQRLPNPLRIQQKTRGSQRRMLREPWGGGGGGKDTDTGLMWFGGSQGLLIFHAESRRGQAGVRVQVKSVHSSTALINAQSGAAGLPGEQ